MASRQLPRYKLKKKVHPFLFVSKSRKGEELWKLSLGTVHIYLCAKISYWCNFKTCVAHIATLKNLKIGEDENVKEL